MDIAWTFQPGLMKVNAAYFSTSVVKPVAISGIHLDDDWSNREREGRGRLGNHERSECGERHDIPTRLHVIRFMPVEILKKFN